MKTLKDYLILSTNFLEKKGVPSSRLICESILAHILGMKRIELYMDFDKPMEEEEVQLLRDFLKDAASHKPFSYITGKMSFYKAELTVSPDVLIPRPETEILLDRVCKNLTRTTKRAVDLCTGSGCLAIGLKKAHPQLDVTGVDVSENALMVAEKNGEANGTEVRWLCGDLTAPVTGETFDLVLCNPPYIAESEFEGLQKSVRDFEPKGALVSGATGYEFFEKLAAELPPLLNEGAQIFFEMGTGQGDHLLNLFSNDYWVEKQVEKDWAGHDRFFSLKFIQNSTIIQ